MSLRVVAGHRRRLRCGRSPRVGATQRMMRAPAWSLMHCARRRRVMTDGRADGRTGCRAAWMILQLLIAMRHSRRHPSLTRTRIDRPTLGIIARYGPITIAIRARFEYDSSTIQLQHATTRYEVFRALAYEIVYENQW